LLAKLIRHDIVQIKRKTGPYLLFYFEIGFLFIEDLFLQQRVKPVLPTKRFISDLIKKHFIPHDFETIALDELTISRADIFMGIEMLSDKPIKRLGV